MVGGGDDGLPGASCASSPARAASPSASTFGDATRGGLPATLRRGRRVLFPVRWEEPWGLVPLEAMAVGTPVVASGRGGSAEYLRDGENCLLFDVERRAAGRLARGR